MSRLSAGPGSAQALPDQIYANACLAMSPIRLSQMILDFVGADDVFSPCDVGEPVAVLALIEINEAGGGQRTERCQTLRPLGATTTARLVQSVAREGPP